MARRSSNVRRARSPNTRETIWSTLLLDHDDVSTAVNTAVNVVDSTDWVSSTSSFGRGATLERVRGNISLVGGGLTTSAAERVYMGLWHVHDDETAPDPSLINDYAENDLLWCGVVEFAQANLTSVGIVNPTPLYLEFDVKAKRKLTTQSIILFTWRGVGTTNTAFISFLLRGLIRKK